MFSVSQFSSNQKPHAPSRTFPLRLDAFNITEEPHTITGVDLSAPEQAPLTVFLRPRKGEEGEGRRPEIINFVIDAIKNAEQSGDQERIRALANDPLAKVFTEPGGVILVEGGYADEETGNISASWLRLLQRKSDVVSVYTNVWARLNKPYQREGSSKITASIDVVHPEQKVKADNLTDLENFTKDVVGRISGGESFAVVKLTSADNPEDVSVRVVKAQRIADPSGDGYIWETPETVVNNFWNSLDAEWIVELNVAVTSGKVIAEVYPGARYYFVKDSLEQIARKGDKHSEQFALPGKEENGFLKCTVTLKAHAGSDNEKFPRGCYPIQPFNDRPIDLANL